MRTIDDDVYGHAQAKKVLHVLLKRSQERYYKKVVMGEEVDKASLRCLLVGQSGTGKTHLINSLHKLHGFPLIMLDATQLMPTGNQEGVNVKQLTKLIHESAKACVERSKTTNDGRFHSEEGALNQMVIFVDEFDKLGCNFDSSGNWNKHVQSSFLTMIDNSREFSGISWIFAGAFSNLYERKNAKKSNIGFFGAAEQAETKEITEEDIIKSGIIPELLGRISLIVQLDTFGPDDYTKVLDSLLPKYPLLRPSEEVLQAMVDKAHTSGQGIRSLTRQLEMMSIDVEYEEPLVFPSRGV